MQNREISIKELTREVVKAWKALLIFSLIFSIGAMIVQYVNSEKIYKNELEMRSKIEKGEYFAEYDLECRKKIGNIIQLKKELVAMQEYIENSTLMKINPFNVNVLTMVYGVETENENSILLNALGEYINTKMSEENITSMPDEDLEETLITVKDDEKRLENRNTLIVKIYGANKEGLEKRERTVEQQIEKKIHELNLLSSKEKIIQLSKDYAVINDDELHEKQEKMRTKYEELQQKYSLTKGELTSEQKKYLEIIEADQNLPSKPGVSKKAILIGFIFGLIMGIMCISFRVLFSEQLYFAKELEKVFNINYFGLIKGNMSEPEKLQYACKIALISCKGANADKVYITGTRISDIADEIRQEIASYFKENGIMVTWGGKLHCDVNELSKMENCGAVIMIETLKHSKFTEIEREIKTIEQLDKKIAGYFVVEK